MNGELLVMNGEGITRPECYEIPALLMLGYLLISSKMSVRRSSAFVLAALAAVYNFQEVRNRHFSLKVFDVFFECNPCSYRSSDLFLFYFDPKQQIQFEMRSELSEVSD